MDDESRAVLGCPEFSIPAGSYVSNGTVETKTLRCFMGTVFPDIKQRSRTLHCKNGQWEEKVDNLPSCVGKFFYIYEVKN